MSDEIARSLKLKEGEYVFDHVGIAVRSIEKSLNFYKSIGFSEVDIEEVPTEKVKVGFLRTVNQANLELIEPLSDDSPIAKFIEKKGEGIHHICLRVKELKPLMERLKSEGVRLTSDEPRPGAHGCLQTFVHPKSTGGVLLELSQKD